MSESDKLKLKNIIAKIGYCVNETVIDTFFNPPPSISNAVATVCLLSCMVDNVQI